MYPIVCPLWGMYKMPSYKELSDNTCTDVYRDNDVKEYELKRKKLNNFGDEEEIIRGRGTPVYTTYYENRKALPKKEFSLAEAEEIGRKLGIDWNTSKFDVQQFRTGINTELEHGLINPSTNVTGNDPLLTGKIALAHLNEFPDYYIRLKKMEQEAKAYWSGINK